MIFIRKYWILSSIKQTDLSLDSMFNSSNKTTIFELQIHSKGHVFVKIEYINQWYRAVRYNSISNIFWKQHLLLLSGSFMMTTSKISFWSYWSWILVSTTTIYWKSAEFILQSIQDVSRNVDQTSCLARKYHFEQQESSHSKFELESKPVYEFNWVH